MNDAQLIPAVLLLSVISVAVVRSLLGEMNGTAEQDEFRAARRTEERKNARIRKEIERWREGR